MSDLNAAFEKVLSDAVTESPEIKKLKKIHLNKLKREEQKELRKEIREENQLWDDQCEDMRKRQLSEQDPIWIQAERIHKKIMLSLEEDL